MDDPGDIEFVSWSDTSLFHNAVKNIESARAYETESGGTVHLTSLIKDPIVYKGKVKLHGSNAGVALCGSTLRAQSRTQFIDQSGFGRLVFGPNESYWRSLVTADGPQRFTVFGEYCGRGVQSGVALANLPSVIFAVFGIDINSRLIVEPDDITSFLTKNGSVKLPENVFVLPWHETDFTIDLSSNSPECVEAVQKVLDRIDEDVLRIDANDPWVEAVFGVKGPGEGLVLYPVSLLSDHPDVPQFRTLDRDTFGSLAFKAKGEKHRAVKAAKSVTINPEKAASTAAFAELMCTVSRLEQGAKAVGGFEMTLIKDFMVWMNNDIQKEGQHELEASNLTWKDVTPAISKACSTWYIAQTKERSTPKTEEES